MHDAGQCGYHYVEVMACPSGCNNGGGQIKQPLAPVHARYAQSLSRREPWAVAENAGEAAWLQRVVCQIEKEQGGERKTGGQIQALQTTFRVRELSAAAQLLEW